MPNRPARFSVAAASPATVVLATIAISFVLRAIFAAMTGLSVDEAYIVGMARAPSLGYFDHPPLTMWLVHAMTWLFGGEASVVVRLPTLLCFAGTTWFVYRTTARLFSPWASAYATVALTIAPLFGAYFGTILVTDGPALFALSIAIDLLTRALFREGDNVSWPAWICVGVAFGVALLAKFTVVLLLPGLALFFLTVPGRRRWLLHPAPYVAAAIALALLSPVLYWNATHQWVTFAFQGGRAAFDGQIHPVRALSYLGILALAFLPGIWLALIVAVARGLRSGPGMPRQWLLACMAAVPIIFFPLVWLFGSQGDFGFQWPAPGYLVAFPLLGWSVEGWMVSRQRSVRLPLIASLATLAVAYVAYLGDYVVGWFPAIVPQAADSDPMIADQVDWWEFRAALAARGLLDPDRAFIIGGNWKDCAKADRVVGDLLLVYCMTANPIGRALAAADQLAPGRDAVIIVNWWSETDARVALAPHFSAIEPFGDVVVTSFGRPVHRLHLLYGRSLTGSLPAPG